MSQAVTEEITLKEIRDSIPAHYFKQDTLRSCSYLLRDIVQVAVTAAVMVSALGWYPGLAFVLWPAYWYIQGMNFTALWVIAHECGHQAFSPSRSVNDTIGFILHSALLVPYHSWRISHGNHHKHTNHLEKDTVFVPEVVDKPLKEAVEESPLATLIGILLMWTIGWPLYLLFNSTGQKYSRRTNHFEPSSPLFRPADRLDVILSDVGILATLAAVSFASSYYGFANVFCWYGIPYLLTNIMLVTITYLQHTDTRVLHYSAKEWNFVRGALCTVDRDYSFLNAWLHHITDSHVVHHLFSTMPFYNAIKATPLVKPVLGSRYMEDHDYVLRRLWQSWRNCRYLLSSEDVATYRK